jgi:hypothetical protein
LGLPPEPPPIEVMDEKTELLPVLLLNLGAPAPIVTVYEVFIDIVNKDSAWFPPPDNSPGMELLYPPAPPPPLLAL